MYDYFYSLFRWGDDLCVAKMALQRGGRQADPIHDRTFHAPQVWQVEYPAELSAAYSSTAALGTRGTLEEPGEISTSVSALLAAVNEARKKWHQFQSLDESGFYSRLERAVQ